MIISDKYWEKDDISSVTPRIRCRQQKVSMKQGRLPESGKQRVPSDDTTYIQYNLMAKYRKITFLAE